MLFEMIIGGEETTSNRWFAVEDPATGDICGHAPDCSPEQLEQAVVAAVKAYPRWRRTSDERSSALHRIAADLRAERDDLALLLTTEQGKPLAESRREVELAASRFSFYSELQLEPRFVRQDERATVRLMRKSIGVVAVLTPWNAPLITAANRMGPALWAGNTIVLKPSPYTPLSTLEFGKILARHLPAGVINVVTGLEGALGERLVRNPAIGKVAFTGSIAVGRAVAAATGEGLTGVNLELGGNDPAILLDDVDLAEIIHPLFWNAFTNCGQICVAIKRVYVPSTLYSEFVHAVSGLAETVIVGDGKDEATQLGPLCNASQVTRIEELVNEAVTEGSLAVAGGSALAGPGHFYRPTILSQATHGMRVVDEEQFGPVLPIIPYDDIDRAIGDANRTHFGLGGSVWSSDVEHALRIGEELECGVVWINNHRVMDVSQPFGGIKASGVVGPTLGVEEFTLPQVVWSPSVVV